MNTEGRNLNRDQSFQTPQTDLQKETVLRVRPEMPKSAHPELETLNI